MGKVSGPDLYFPRLWRIQDVLPRSTKGPSADQTQATATVAAEAQWNESAPTEFRMCQTPMFSLGAVAKGYSGGRRNYNPPDALCDQLASR